MRKNPKSVLLWNDALKAVIKRKEDALKQVLGARDEAAKENLWKHIDKKREKIKRCIHISHHLFLAWLAR